MAMGVMAALAAGCGGSAPRSQSLGTRAVASGPTAATTVVPAVTSTTTTTSTTTVVPSTTTTTTRICTAADLADPGRAAMPSPTRLDQAETFPDEGISLVPPDATDRAVATPESAWANAAIDKRRDATYRIVLARVSATDPATIGANGDQTPQYQNVLAWVVLSHGVPEATRGGTAPAGSTTSTTVACFFADGVAATDAISGQAMFSADFGPGT
jgi:hypothetical protein